MQERADTRGSDKPAETADMTAGGALLARLKKLGVDYVFANSGTDFPPLIEAIAEAQASGRAQSLPEALVIPHEHAAMGMAYGYYLATGKAQAVIAHTNVGLANCVIGSINAAAERVPVLLFSGRTPITERGRFGSRLMPIGWGQEMRDQAGMVREVCKWDYELKFPEQVVELTDRMHAIAHSTPPGPVYMSLPREVLAEPSPGSELRRNITMRPALAGPVRAQIAELARLIEAAERPVIFAQHGPRTDDGFKQLTALVERLAIPVVQYWANQLAIPTTHPMWAGIDPEPWLSEADLVIVLDSLVPWVPDQHQPAAGAKVVQIGTDPLMARFPVRNFQADMAIVGEVDDVVAEVVAALPSGKKAAPKRKKLVAERTAAIRARIKAAAEAGCRSPMTKDWVALCISNAVKSRENATVLTELGAPLGPMEFTRREAWYEAPHSGGLGWGFPTGLGIQLADRKRLVVATMGDGSYLFANPTACHMIAEAMKLPVLTLILNNTEWGAVRRAVNSMYPDGAAVRSNLMPLTALTPSPDFTKVAAANRCWAERVENGSDLPAALERALAHIETTGTQALLDVAVAK